MSRIKKSTELAAIKRPRGRPLTYTPEAAHEVCRRMAAGENLLAICKTPGMPPASTVRTWAVDDVDGFAAMYTRARQVLAEHWADEIITISDYPPTRTPDGRVDHGAVMHQRLMVDTRKWLCCKVLPKIYGDRLGLDQSNSFVLNVITGVPESDHQF